MKFRPQFGIRFVLVTLALTALGLFIWQSIPTHGKPILYGQIVDTSGVPIPDVEIVLHWGAATRFRGQTTTTDRQGNFRFAPLDTGSAIISDNGGFPRLYIGICVSHPDFRAADGADWWDISVPRIKNHRHPWNLVMAQRSADHNIQTGADQ